MYILCCVVFFVEYGLSVMLNFNNCMVLDVINNVWFNFNDIVKFV